MRKIVSYFVIVTLVAAHPLAAATVKINFPVGPDFYTPGAGIPMQGTADWSDGGNTVDTVVLRLIHKPSNTITDSVMVTVEKEPGPPVPSEGTWNSVENSPQQGKRPII